MNQMCRVCGESAAGFHFGAFTCEGCKSFFGRTYNNRASIQPCKNGGTCIINRRTRTSCKACRLKKCESVGMSKSSSRYGRRSNWFKLAHLLRNGEGPSSQGQDEQDKEEENEEKQNEEENDEPVPSCSGLNNPPPNNIITDDVNVPSTSQGNPAIPSRNFTADEQNQRMLEEALSLHEQALYNENKNHMRILENIHLGQQAQRRLMSFRSSAITPREIASSSSSDNQPQQTSHGEMIASILRSIPSCIPGPFQSYMLESSSRNGLNGNNGSSSSNESNDENRFDVERRSNASRIPPVTPSRMNVQESPNRRPRSPINNRRPLHIPTYHHPIAAVACPPGGMTTLAEHSARGDDTLLRISPNPGGLADVYEPIDLSTRANRSSSQIRESSPEAKRRKQEDDNSTEETALNPLDLTFPNSASCP